MIPDKLFIAAQWRPKEKKDEYYASATKTTHPREKEYIRKDALLDYFRQRVEELNSPLNGVFGSTEREHCNERISELLLLIDKLNRM